MLFSPPSLLVVCYNVCVHVSFSARHVAVIAVMAEARWGGPKRNALSASSLRSIIAVVVVSARRKGEGGKLLSIDRVNVRQSHTMALAREKVFGGGPHQAQTCTVHVRMNAVYKYQWLCACTYPLFVCPQ